MLYVKACVTMINRQQLVNGKARSPFSLLICQIFTEYIFCFPGRHLYYSTKSSNKDEPPWDASRPRPSLLTPSSMSRPFNDDETKYKRRQPSAKSGINPELKNYLKAHIHGQSRGDEVEPNTATATEKHLASTFKCKLSICIIYIFSIFYIFYR